jgi:hypothetical protein
MALELESRYARKLLRAQQRRAGLRNPVCQQIVWVCAPEVERFQIHTGKNKVWRLRFANVKAIRENDR